MNATVCCNQAEGVFLLDLKGKEGKKLGPLLLFNPLCFRDACSECNEGTVQKIVDCISDWIFVNLLSIHNCFLSILQKMHS